MTYTITKYDLVPPEALYKDRNLTLQRCLEALGLKWNGTIIFLEKDTIENICELEYMLRIACKLGIYGTLELQGVGVDPLKYEIIAGTCHIFKWVGKIAWKSA